MAMKIWEIHAMQFRGAIRTSADGDAEIGGLRLSEKGYLLAVRDYRPRGLVQLVEDLGPENAADELLQHYREPAPGQPGHGLVVGRSRMGDSVLCRSDEVKVPAREFA